MIDGFKDIYLSESQYKYYWTNIHSILARASIDDRSSMPSAIAEVSESFRAIAARFGCAIKWNETDENKI